MVSGSQRSPWRSMRRRTSGCGSENSHVPPASQASPSRQSRDSSLVAGRANSETVWRSMLVHPRSRRDNGPGFAPVTVSRGDADGSGWAGVVSDVEKWERGTSRFAGSRLPLELVESQLMSMKLMFAALAVAAGVAVAFQGATNQGLLKSAGIGPALIIN